MSREHTKALVAYRLEQADDAISSAHNLLASGFHRDKVGFWRNPHAREVRTKALVRDLDNCGLCRPGKERDLSQRLVALAKENHESLTR